MGRRRTTKAEPPAEGPPLRFSRRASRPAARNIVTLRMTDQELETLDAVVAYLRSARPAERVQRVDILREALDYYLLHGPDAAALAHLLGTPAAAKKED